MYTYIMICKEHQQIGKWYKFAPMVFPKPQGTPWKSFHFGAENPPILG